MKRMMAVLLAAGMLTGSIQPALAEENIPESTDIIDNTEQVFTEDNIAVIEEPIQAEIPGNEEPGEITMIPEAEEMLVIPGTEEVPGSEEIPGSEVISETEEMAVKPDEMTYLVSVQKVPGGKIRILNTEETAAYTESADDAIEDIRTVQEGTEIILMAEPQQGYQLAELHVMKEDGMEVPLEQTDLGFRFLMPGNSVTVISEFRTADPEDTEASDVTPEKTDAKDADKVDAEEAAEAGEDEEELLNASTTYQISDTITGTLNNGVLTVSGTGEMPSYYNGDVPPWTKDASAIRSIVIEEGITSIGVFSFYKLTSAESVVIPDSVTVMEGRSFCDCTSLKKVTLPPQLKTLEDCFMGCSGLEELIINEGCESLKGNFLCDCKSMHDLHIPASVKSISDYAFQDSAISTVTVDPANTVYTARDNLLLTRDGKTLVLCPPLRTDTFFAANGIETIGGYAFAHMKTLKQVDLTGVKKIEGGAFQGTGLESVVIPDSVTEIGKYAFDSSDIRTVSFGSGISSLPYCGFTGCRYLEEVYLPPNIKVSEAYSFADCVNLKKITIEAVEVIPYEMLGLCEKLQTVILGNGVKRINREAFEWCSSLRQVTIPESVVYVDNSAFPATTVLTVMNANLIPYGTGGYREANQVTLTGTRNYQKAFEVLELVNSERAKNGLGKLYMDQSLLESAMVRAAECSACFAHTRPDGTSCFTANAKMAAENIAAGDRQAAGVMNTWMNSQGHRQNILTGKFNNIGIGCFEINGVCYWVQCFGTDTISGNCLQPANSTMTQNMTLPTEQFEEAPTGSGVSFIIGQLSTYAYTYRVTAANTTIKKGTSTQAAVSVKNGSSDWGSYTPIDAGSVIWSSSNGKVASVDSRGVIAGKTEGTAVITAKSKQGRTLGSVSVTVNATGQSAGPAHPGTNGSNNTGGTNTGGTNGNTGTSGKPGTGGTNGTAGDEAKKIPHVSYCTHVQTYGWQDYVKDGQMSGTEGESKRLEGIKINLPDQPYSGGIEYRTHVQTYGWQDWRSNGQMAGTSGEAKRLEAIQIRLTGEMAKHYDVYYRTHIQTFGWSGWAYNGEMCGSAGFSKRLEGIKIMLVEKGKAAPGSTANSFYMKPGSGEPAAKTSGALVGYNTHVQTYGWQNYMYDGDMAGTSGQSKRLEGIHIGLIDRPYSGDIVYRTHVQTYGWQGWKKNGQMSGTSGESKRLEGIQIYLTGDMAKHYDVYYRVHAQTYGWLGWAKNGEMAGTSGLAKRLEGINIKLVPKGGKAPGSTVRPNVVGGSGRLPDNPYKGG